MSVESGPDWGSAVLFVSPVTDALKTVSHGRIVGAVDRESVSVVEAVGLSTDVVDRLKSMPPTLVEIHRAVVELGFRWETRPRSLSQNPSAP